MLPSSCPRDSRFISALNSTLITCLELKNAAEIRPCQRLKRRLMFAPGKLKILRTFGPRRHDVL